jgi:hypothetical protein
MRSEELRAWLNALSDGELRAATVIADTILMARRHDRLPDDSTELHEDVERALGAAGARCSSAPVHVCEVLDVVDVLDALNILDEGVTARSSEELAELFAKVTCERCRELLGLSRKQPSG